MDVREEELQDLYMWVDGIPLSRPKKNIARDFSDGGVCSSLAVDQFTCLLVPPLPPTSLTMVPATLRRGSCTVAAQCSWQRLFTASAPAWSSYTTTGLHLLHAPLSTCAAGCPSCCAFTQSNPSSLTECLERRSAANGMAQKLYNWSTLNTRVFKRLGFVVAQHECEVIPKSCLNA